MTPSTQWQLKTDSAQRYQNILTPYILGHFAEALVDFAEISPKEKVIGIGCGTGAAARYAAKAVGNGETIAAIDIIPAMIEVARSVTVSGSTAIEWKEANAIKLPYADQSFDLVMCAQTLQFLADKPLALEEMNRLIKPTGRVAVSLWCPINNNPYFEALTLAISKYISSDVAQGLGAAFSLTEASEIQELFSHARFVSVKLVDKQLYLPLPDLRDFIPHHISATPMAEAFDSVAKRTKDSITDEIVSKLDSYGFNEEFKIPFNSHLILASNQP